MSAYLNKRNPPLTESSTNDSERMWFLPNSDMKAHCVNLMRRNQLRLIQCRQILRAVWRRTNSDVWKLRLLRPDKSWQNCTKGKKTNKGETRGAFLLLSCFCRDICPTAAIPKWPCCKMYVIPYHSYIITLVLLATDFRAVWKKICYQRNQSVRVARIWQMCSVTAETKCLSTTPRAFNWITIHDNFKNRTETKHKTQS